MSDEDVWRRFYIRTWSDKRVMALSRPPPNGQTLLTWLIAGKQTGIIPGLFEVGERAFAEMLGWPLHGGEALLEGFQKGLPKGFRESFAEVSAQGFAKADWNARLVYVPNALKLDPPWNPNMVLKWRKAWRALPDCALKDEAAQAFTLFFEGFGKGFQEAFAVVCGKGLANQDSGFRKQDSGSRRVKKAPPAPEIAPAEERIRDTESLARPTKMLEPLGLGEYRQHMKRDDRPAIGNFDDRDSRDMGRIITKRPKDWQQVLALFVGDTRYQFCGWSLKWLAANVDEVAQKTTTARDPKVGHHPGAPASEFEQDGYLDMRTGEIRPV